MRVEAIKEKMDVREYVGYYNLVRRRAGDVFDLTDDKHFSSRWMKRVESSKEKTNAPGEPTLAEQVELNPALTARVDGRTKEGRAARGNN